MLKGLDQHLKIISENTIDLISSEELTQKIKGSLRKNKPLIIKIGFDPTARDIHLGHTVLLHKLRKIQDLGHIVYFVIGDFTAQIGDPSGKMALRPVLTKKEINDNARTYTDQAFRILDKKRTKVVFNSKWYKNMKASELLSLFSHYTVARIIERDDFSKRLAQGKPLSLQELVYPIIQGYDSVMLGADIEFGGTDQKFNLIVGRHLQHAFGQPSQSVITLPLLVGLDGVNKMSKSLNNYIGITDSSKDMFGKLMSVSDELMWDYMRLLTSLDVEEAKKMHPKDAKVLLASEIVSFYHSKTQAKKEEEEFARVFSNKEIPDDIKTVDFNQPSLAIDDLVGILCEAKLATSKNEARRLIKQKAVSVEGVPVSQAAIDISQGSIFKIGKRRFLKIVYRKS